MEEKLNNIHQYRNCLINSLYYQLKGGDWGAAIGGNMATLFPENVLGNKSC